MKHAAEPFDYESAIEACARGERHALRAIYDREARRLLGVVHRIFRNEETAQDILQEAFLLIRQRAACDQRALGSARGWIYTVVRHRAVGDRDPARLGDQQLFELTLEPEAGSTTSRPTGPVLYVGTAIPLKGDRSTGPVQ